MRKALLNFAKECFNCKKLKKLCIFSSLFILGISNFLTSKVYSDVLRLVNGQVLTGVIVSEDSTIVTFRSEVGTVEIKRELISSIEKESLGMNFIRRGDIAFSKEEWEKAAQAYETALKIDPTLKQAEEKLKIAQENLIKSLNAQLSQLLREGDKFLERRLFDSAIGFYSDLIARYSEDKYIISIIKKRLASAYYQRAYYLLDRISKKEAIKDLEQAIAYDSTLSSAYFLLGDIYLSLADGLENAIKYYNISLTLDSTNWAGYYNRAEAKFKKREFNEAIADYLIVLKNGDEALQKKAAEKLGQIYLQLGEEALQRKDFELAICYFTTAVVYKPNSDKAYLDIGRAYFLKKAYPEAIVSFKQAIKLNYSSVSAHFLLAECYRLLNKFPEAIAEYKITLQLQPENYLALVYLGEIHLTQGLYNDAISYFKKALEIEKNLFLAHFGLGMAYEKLEKYREAAQAYQKATEIKPDDVSAHNRLGLMYKNLKMYNQALEEFQIALKINPKDPSVWNNIGLVNVALGLYYNAISNFLTAIEIDPDFLEAYVNLGDAYRIKKNWQEALLIYSKVTEKQVDYADAYLGLGIIYHDFYKDYNKAIEYYKLYLKYGGKNITQVETWIKEASLASERKEEK